MSDPIAAFLAKGGKITKVNTGVRATNERQMYDAVRGIVTKPVDNSEQDNEIYMEAVREAALMGGQSAAIQAMNDFRPVYRKGTDTAKRDAQRRMASQRRYNEEWGCEY
jgi:hypothetical protein